MTSFPPNNCKKWCSLMEKLGFVREAGGKHANKFKHPSRKTSDYKQQPDFIIIPHKIYKGMSCHIKKELNYFGFTDEEIKKGC